MNCTPKGREPFVGVAENLASGAAVIGVLLASGAGVLEVPGVLGVLLQPIKAANTSVIKARIVWICLAFSQLKDLDFLSNP